MEEVKRQITKDTDPGNLRSFSGIFLEGRPSHVRRWLVAAILAGIVLLFLPWTQNIRAKGNVTTLRQEGRPQHIHSVIAGRIAKWYVREGDFVRKGDTLVQLAEIKDSYLDPMLLSRSEGQLRAKNESVSLYETKVRAIDDQIEAMQSSLQAKISQLRRKVISDSMDVLAAENDYRIADAQFQRMQVMRDSGLASAVQLEQRSQSRQSALAKKVSAENKYQNTKTEISQVLQDYNEKVFKARSEQASARSDMANANAEVLKLSNQNANYQIRNQLYFIIAPQDGQVVNAVKAGINEIVKEGENIADIVPAPGSFAVEVFVSPVDVPLLSVGQTVKFLFDGYPAIVFSGWPGASYGIFSGRIVAIENTVSANGKFRILVGEDDRDKPWPKTLRMGVGASAIALLKDVPVWYELWRNINGFPPDYYKPKTTESAYAEKK